MIKKKLTRLIGLKKEEFDNFLKNGQIHAQKARLIPTLKTGDEMALTSIFLSAVRLIKEYRDWLFRDIKLSRGGKVHFYTEVAFADLGKLRIDGMILVVKSGVIKDVAFFEMKNKNNGIDQAQIEGYIAIAKQLGVKVMVTVSNEFVSDPTHSPIQIKVPKNINLLHFSWTYLLTRGHILLFKNEHNIQDHDQVEIMREVLVYLESPVSGVSGYTQMKPGWKELAENVRAQKPLKASDSYIEDAVLSWHEEEKDMALLLSRKLGVLVKSTPKTKNSLKSDIKRLVKENYLSATLSIKNAVSDIQVIPEFERRTVNMSIKIIPPMNKGTVARISWIGRQLDNCSRKNNDLFQRLQPNIWIEANIKFARENLKIKLSDIDQLSEMVKGKEVQAFHVVLINGFGAKFASNKKFIELIEQMVLDYYEGIVQHVTSWSRPAPRLSSKVHQERE